MTETLETILRDGFILVFNSETLDVVETARALQEAGVRNMEVTCRIKDAPGKLRALKKALPKFKAGAASLLDVDRRPPGLPSVKEMVDAGADFLVSAVNFRPQTYRDHGGRLPIIPGCGSANEIVTQHQLGANLCKLFPAAQLGGPKFLEAIDPAIHRRVSVMPTGGTTEANIPDYVAAGALVLGGSFSMLSKEEQSDYGRLAAGFKRVKALIDAKRAAKYPALDFKTADLTAFSTLTGRDFNA